MSQLSVSSSDDEPLIIEATPLTPPSSTGAALLRAAAKLQTSTPPPPPQARQSAQPAQARLQLYKSPTTRQPTRPAKITSRGPSRQHPQMSRPQPSAKPGNTVFRRLGPLPNASARNSGTSAANTSTTRPSSSLRLTRNPSGPPPAAFSPRSTARVPHALPKRTSRASPPSTLTDSRSRQAPAATRQRPGQKPRPATPVRPERKHHASVRRKTFAPLLSPLSPALTTSEWRRFLKTCSALGTPSVLSPLPPTPPRPRPTRAVRPSPIVVSDDSTPPSEASTVILPPRTAVQPARRFGDITHMIEVRRTRDVATQTTATQPARTSVATTTASTQTPAAFFWSLLPTWVRRQLEHLIARSRSRARDHQNSSSM
nr:PREDICTED: nascent polypeptide-associated complex subunit alpha, muscle-specific form-like [Bemisia tabaci]